MPPESDTQQTRASEYQMLCNLYNVYIRDDIFFVQLIKLSKLKLLMKYKRQIEPKSPARLQI